jgi:Protein of unknown function (DUF3618)
MPTLNESPEQIEDEIRGTRREIDRTLSALQSKLSPGQLLDQTLAYLKGGGGEFAANFGRTISANPVPVTLVGLGLAWMMISGQARAPVERNRPGDWRSNGEYAPNGGQDDTGGPELAKDGPDGGSRIARAGESIQQGMSRIREAVEGTRDAAAGYGHAARETAESVKERAGDYAHAAWERGVRAKESTAQTLQEYPVLVGVLGLAAGALAAALLPGTRREDALIGEKADALKRSVTDAVRETAKEATEAVAAAANEKPPPETADMQVHDPQAGSLERRVSGEDEPRPT